MGSRRLSTTVCRRLSCAMKKMMRKLPYRCDSQCCCPFYARTCSHIFPLHLKIVLTFPRFTSKMHHAQPHQQGDTQGSKMSSAKGKPGIHKYEDVANSAFAAPDDNLAKYTSRLSRFMSKEQVAEKAAVADFDAKFENYERGNPYW